MLKLLGRKLFGEWCDRMHLLRCRDVRNQWRDCLLSVCRWDRVWVGLFILLHVLGWELFAGWIVHLHVLSGRVLYRCQRCVGLHLVSGRVHLERRLVGLLPVHSGVVHPQWLPHLLRMRRRVLQRQRGVRLLGVRDRHLLSEHRVHVHVLPGGQLLPHHLRLHLRLLLGRYVRHVRRVPVLVLPRRGVLL